MKRAASYLRVSTAAQARRNREPEGYSIPAQREACARKAAELGLQVVEEYVDRGESAKTTDRPALRALLERVKRERDLDYVIVHKVDRLARNRYDDATISYALHRAGVTLASVSENIDETPFGRFMHAIVAANAEFYSANLAAEARKGLIQKAKTGGTPTRAPLGYLNVRELVDGREIRTVASTRSARPRPLRLRRPTPPAPTRWTPSARRSIPRGLTTRPTPSRPTKPAVAGPARLAAPEPLLHRHRPLRRRRIRRPPRAPDRQRPAFARARAVLEAHNHAGEKDRKHHHYLKGTLYCGRCGSRMSLIHAKGNGGTYPYFFCIGACAARAANSHTAPSRRSSARRAHLRERRALEPEQVELVRAKLDARARRACAPRPSGRAGRQRRLAKLATSERLLHAYYPGAVPLDLLKQEQERLAGEIGRPMEAGRSGAVIRRRSQPPSTRPSTCSEAASAYVKAPRAPTPPVEPSPLPPPRRPRRRHRPRRDR